jgi:hypothetical protein
MEGPQLAEGTAFVEHSRKELGDLRWLVEVWWLRREGERSNSDMSMSEENDGGYAVRRR